MIVIECCNGCGLNVLKDVQVEIFLNEFHLPLIFTKFSNDNHMSVLSYEYVHILVYNIGMF